MPNSDREALNRAIGGVLFNVSNFPEKAQTRLLGQDMGPLNDKLTDAILAAGFRQAPTEVTDTMIEAFDAEYYRAFDATFDAWTDYSVPWYAGCQKAGFRAALEAALGGTK